jgi:hypothetical protein
MSTVYESSLSKKKKKSYIHDRKKKDITNPGYKKFIKQPRESSKKEEQQWLKWISEAFCLVWLYNLYMIKTSTVDLIREQVSWWRGKEQTRSTANLGMVPGEKVPISHQVVPVKV